MAGLDAVEELIPQHEVRSERVSKWSVGMQLHHVLLAANYIVRALEKSVPGEGRPSFSLLKTVVMWTGKIPRGRGRAPDRSIPEPDVTAGELEELLESAQIGIAKVRSCNPKCWIEHPVFGVMRRDAALRFLEIHTRHHLAIVRDILAAQPYNRRGSRSG